MTFRYDRLTFGMRARETVRFGRMAANRLRGALGSQLDAAWFAPRSQDGPSGLRDRPRPFVLRSRNLDGVSIAPGESFTFALHIFDEQAAAAIAGAFDRLRWADLISIHAEPIVVDPAPQELERVAVTFLSATELKSGERIVDRPEFEVLFARAAERVMSLQTFYGAGSASAFPSFHARLIEWKGEHTTARRTSTRTGQTHPLGGFTGRAVYEGELGPAVPWLEVAAHTGVGRQTVWGKGEISVERLDESRRE